MAPSQIAQTMAHSPESSKRHDSDTIVAAGYAADFRMSFM
jgi:hypothetical protein